MTNTNRPTDATGRRTRRAGVRLLALLACLGGVLTLAPVRAQERGSGDMEVVGRLPRLWPQGRQAHAASAPHLADVLVIDSPARRAYVLYSIDAIGQRPCQLVGIRSYDLDTLRPLRFATIEGRVRPTSLAAGREFDYALDPENRRLYLPVRHQGAPCSTDTRAGINQDRLKEIAVVDLAAFDGGEERFERARLGIPVVQRAVLEPRSLVGIRYYRDPDDDTGKLLLAFSEINGVHEGTNYLAQWLADTGEPDPRFHGATGAPYQLQSCRGQAMGGTSTTNLPVWRSPNSDAIITVCQGGGLVIRVALGDGGAPQSELVEPVPQVNSTVLLADPASDRLLMHTGSSLWVFDGAHMGLVGSAGMRAGGFGVDEGTGRLYALGDNGATTGEQRLAFQGGLFVLDARLTPAPQALLFPEFAYPGYEPIRIDDPGGGRPRRVFVRRADAVDNGQNLVCFSYPSGEQDRACPPEDFWLVVEDTLALGRQPSLADLDQNTVDHAEQDGVTEANFEGTGSAYGSRALLVGGFRAAMRTRNRGAESEAAEGFSRNLGLEPACWSQTREFRGAWVENATEADVETTAGSHALWADPATREDLLAPSARCSLRSGGGSPTIDALVTGVERDEQGNADEERARTYWQLAPAECVHDGAQQSPASGEAAAFSGASALLSGSAQATCQAEEQDAQASARGGALVLAGEVRVADSKASVHAWRDKDGVHVEARAEARGIRVGTLSIALVRSVAVSHAGGRPGTAKTNAGEQARLERLVCGVRVHGEDEVTTEGSNPQCFTEDQLDEFAARVNSSPGFRGQVRIHPADPDPGWARGTPGGYAAAVTRDTFEALNAEFLYGDVAAEVPGLEITLYRDTSSEVGRTIVELAAVRAVTTYGIFLLPQSFDLPPLPPEVSFEPAAVLPDDGALPLTAYGSEPAPPPAAPPAPPAPAPPRIVALPAGGFMARPLGEGLLTSLMWFLVGLPVYLAARRRAFGRTFQNGGV